MRRSWVVWLCALLLLNSFYVVGSNITEDTISMPGGDEVNYVPHAPIRIDSDADFPGIASAGDGSELSPWIIEGWDINGTGIKYCIYIGNTTEYFVVRDCNLHEATIIFFSGGYGLSLYNIANGKAINNTITQNGGGLLISGSNNLTISFNNISSNERNGFSIGSSNDLNITYNNVSENNRGISQDQSFNNIISHNNVFSNLDGGITLDESGDNLISNNSVISNFEYGIYIGQSVNSTISNNSIISNPDCGMKIGACYNISVLNNSFINCSISIGKFFDGDYLIYWNSHTIDINNTVNGKPIYYGKNQVEGSIPIGVGEVILANCTGMTIENQNMSFGTVGMELGFCNNIDIIDNIASSNNQAIFLCYTDNTTITNNSILLNNKEGIYLWYSNNNTIWNNSVTSNNLYGFYLASSINNIIYNNNLINNINQAYDDGTNSWDNGYPFGGNYWNNFNTSLYVGNESFFASDGVEGFYLGHNEHTPGFYGTEAVHEIRYVWDNDWSFIYTLIEGVDFDINLTTGWVQLYWGLLAIGDQFYVDYTCLATPNDLFFGPNQDIPGSDFIYDVPYAVMGGANEDLYPLAYPIIDGKFQREPIRIDSNADFDQAHGVINWDSGDGSPGNPWIIEKWDINGAGYGYCIYVGNTTEYFIIRNCCLHNADGVISFPFYSDSGIHLFNVQNAKIENNIVNLNANVGITIISSNNNIIADNNIYGSAAGISLLNTELNYIVNNTIVQCGEGIKANYANIDSLYNNTITGNSSQNLTLFQGEHVWQECESDMIEQANAITWEDYLYTHRLASYQKVVNINNCSAYAVHVISDILDDIDLSIFYDSNFNGIIDPYESIENGEMGVVHYGDWSMGGYALCADADGDEAIKLINPPDGQYIIAVYGWGVNTGSVEGEGPPANFNLYISEDEDSNGLISRGINAVNCDLTIHGNNITNFELGLYGSALNTSVISNNTFSDNCVGINLLYSLNSEIYGNIISSCNYGIYLWDSNDSMVYHNSLIDNTQQGFSTGNNNLWDNGYPSGGNYWSDYAGADMFSGPNQDEAGFDDIGDIPYFFDFNQDNYPLWPHEFNGTLFSIPLTDGWNLISFSLIPVDTAVENLLGSIHGNWDIAKWYDASDKADPWKTYGSGRSTNDLIDIDNTMGFWLHVTDSTDDLIIYGVEPVSTNITLEAGWNLVSYPTTNSTATVADALWGTGADRVEVCDLAEPGLIKEVGPTYIMQPGEGYWIHVSVDSVWTVDW